MPALQPPSTSGGAKSVNQNRDRAPLFWPARPAAHSAQLYPTLQGRMEAADRGPWMAPSAATTTQGTVRNDRARAPGRTEGRGLPWRHLMWPSPPSQHARLVSPADDEPIQGSRKSSRTETHRCIRTKRRSWRHRTRLVSETNSNLGPIDRGIQTLTEPRRGGRQLPSNLLGDESSLPPPPTS